MAKRYTAPKYLSEAASKKWNGIYDAALKQAKVNFPDDENQQHTQAYKEANKMLAIQAPESAADIDDLEDWQVLLNSRKSVVIDGVEHRACVTIDGRKHAHPAKVKKAPAATPAAALATV